MNLQADQKNILLKELSGIADQLSEKLSQKPAVQQEFPGLPDMFRRCFMNTAETTLRLSDEGVFLITGDIEAMWLRDSSAQVVQYLPFVKDHPAVREMVRGLILKQFHEICIDPYANAFNDVPKVSMWRTDRTEMNDWEWERKYEIDSLCYPVRLLNDYYTRTQDASVFTEEVHEGLRKIVTTFRTEQHHCEDSGYSFFRQWPGDPDVLSFDGHGAPVRFTGMTWSGFRPSDDACTYGYLIPSNLFASVILPYVSTFAKEVYQDDALLRDAAALAEEISAGIQAYGLLKDTPYGEIYAYETDGNGNYNFMDDANVPSLLSLPWLNVCKKDDPLYKRTRAAVLSDMNPYYYEGTAASGIGSPHTPPRYIWHIALCMQGLTSDDEAERMEMLRMLTATDAGTGFMHEGFLCDDPAQFTRSWFAWANSLFAHFVMDLFGLAE